MFCYRITKYNPDFRDEDGAFQGEDRISISDVGKNFSGRILTFEEYLSVENKYISSALHFFNETNLKNLSVVGLEQKQDQKRNVEDVRFSGIDYEKKNLREGVAIDVSNLPQLCRLVLREIIWCRLKSGQDFYIHFGYDYYMYIRTSVWPDSSVNFAKELGLFVEEMESPYLESPEE
jgi:hypothetical protein